MNLWMFLTLAVIGSGFFGAFASWLTHLKQMKKLEVEAMKAEKANTQLMIDNAVEEKLKDYKMRIEALETIVTDKSYELNQKITNLK